MDAVQKGRGGVSEMKGWEQRYHGAQAAPCGPLLLHQHSLRKFQEPWLGVSKAMRMLGQRMPGLTNGTLYSAYAHTKACYAHQKPKYSSDVGGLTVRTRSPRVLGSSPEVVRVTG